MTNEDVVTFRLHGRGAQSVICSDLSVKILNVTLMLWIVITVLSGVPMQPEAEGSLPELLNQSMRPNTRHLYASYYNKACVLNSQPVFSQIPSQEAAPYNNPLCFTSVGQSITAVI
jgi:hypothetical protein